MKLILFVSHVIFASISANLIDPDYSILLQRAMELENRAQTSLKSYQNLFNNSHLLSELDKQSNDLVQLVGQLRDLELNLTARTHEFDEFEVKLLSAENRLEEELDFVNSVHAFYDNKTDNPNMQQLIYYGLKLISDVNAHVIKHLVSMYGTEEFKEICIKVQIMEKFIKEFKFDQPDRVRQTYIETYLIMHERTLKALVEKDLRI